MPTLRPRITKQNVSSQNQQAKCAKTTPLRMSPRTRTPTQFFSPASFPRVSYN